MKTPPNSLVEPQDSLRDFVQILPEEAWPDLPELRPLTLDLAPAPKRQEARAGFERDNVRGRRGAQ